MDGAVIGGIILITWPILLFLYLKQRKKIKTLTEQLASTQSEYRSGLEARNARERDVAQQEERERKSKSRTDLYNRQISDMETKLQAAEAKLESTKRRTEKYAALARSIQNAQERLASPEYKNEILLQDSEELQQLLTPLDESDLKCLQIKELRAKFRANQKDIEKLVETYQGRYTTKTNAALYKLMTLALEAEFRNILYTLRFGKLQPAKVKIKELTTKYYQIVAEGNQSIAPTISKFIGQLESYYLEALEIEYEYYVKLEAAKEQQRALREQMRQEAEERKELERQRKKIEEEQEKYRKEIERIKESLAAAQGAEADSLQDQLDKVQGLLNDVNAKREDIINLQNGKAGTVYVISNIGSFGNDVFKVGMTRRLEPMDRVNELSNASVPFPFDVHSFIFSEDAVELETKLHHILNDKRVNKVNLRKEFFNVSLDELQKLVEECDPSAAFNRTAAAEQFYQSQSIEHVNESLLSISDDEDEDLEEDV